MAKIDYTSWDREQLINEIEQLRKRKKYGLVWEDKPENVVEQCKTELPVLEEVKNKEIITDPDKPVNLLIEGDNYHALSVLNYTHKGKIDVIYIDPPYNTGKTKEWKYNDKYVDEYDGYKHSKWLNMMAKRLKLAKNILAENGVIFISISDHEGSQLKVLMDNIFGEDNFIARLVWENKEGGGGSDSEFFRIKHEYILVYAKKKEKLFLDGEYAEEDSTYNYQDEYIEERGKYKLIKLNSFSIQYSQSLDYEIELPNGEKILPSENNKKGCWRWSKKKFLWGVENKFIIFKKNQDGKMWVYTKQYFKVDENNKPINRKTPYRGVISKWSSTLATKQLEKIFNNKKFDYPKPYELIQFLISLYTNKNSIVLDFFAGSGTTGHAVLELNNEDDGSRMFVLCTNNENDICKEVTFPRIQKVIHGYSYKGSDKKILFQKKITYGQLEKSNGIMQEIKEVIEKNKLLFDKIEKKFEDNILRIIGIKNIDDKKEGLGGNLKYFKTSFVPADPTDKNKIAMTEKATEMLCVKEDTFEEVKSTKQYKIFRNKKRYTGIVFDHQAIDDFKKEIAKIDGKFSLYIFSLGDDTFDEEFEDMKKKVKLSPIPEAILRVYRRIFK